MTLGELVGCVGQGWQPGIGDPGLSGWLTVVDYALCAVLALLVACRRGALAGRAFWAVLVGLLIALGINKQLDLQTALIQAGRCLALAQGWYEERRIVQVAMIVVLVIGSLTGIAIASRALRDRAATNAVALLGLGVLVTFVLIRAISFHQIDLLINVQLPGARVNFVIENAGIVLIAANASWHLARGYPAHGRAGPQPRA